MRRILAVFVSIAWVGVGPSPATAQSLNLATLAAQVQAMQATIAAQAQQIAALQEGTATGFRSALSVLA